MNSNETLLLIAIVLSTVHAVLMGVYTYVEGKDPGKNKPLLYTSLSFLGGGALAILLLVREPLIAFLKGKKIVPTFSAP